jgi:SAM-dependent methyltransferase
MSRFFDSGTRSLGAGTHHRAHQPATTIGHDALMGDPTLPGDKPPDDGTWHHGLMARYWAEFNEPEPDELAWYRRAIETFGQPALDLGCGTGRLLIPLAAAGFDVDGVDVSADMLDWARRNAEGAGVSPGLHRQAMHKLDLDRRYRTIYCCDSLGIGGDRANDLEALKRAKAHLEPGGALVFSIEPFYSEDDPARFARWLPGHHVGAPRDWRDHDDRRVATGGDEFELDSRILEVDPLLARYVMEIRVRLWRDGTIVAEEVGRLADNSYLLPELRLMLDVAGFTDVTVQGRYNDRPATADDTTVVFLARA